MSFAPAGWQLGYAAIVMALLGLPHGASDAAILPRGERAGFALIYGMVALAMLALWHVSASAGLALLLTASIAHFALDPGLPPEPAIDWPASLLLVGGPALLHHRSLVDLFAELGTSRPDLFADVLRLIGLAGGAAMMLALAVRGRRSVLPAPLLLGGVAAAILLPPLIGFATGFVLLHARAQTIARARLLGHRTLAEHARGLAPVALATMAMLAIVALSFLGSDGAGPRALFAAIFALAMPHMIVTPLWQARRTSVGLLLPG